VSDQEYAELGRAEMQQEIERVIAKAALALNASEREILAWAAGVQVAPRRKLVNLAEDLAL
jgi:hypothetical protein